MAGGGRSVFLMGYYKHFLFRALFDVHTGKNEVSVTKRGREIISPAEFRLCSGYQVLPGFICLAIFTRTRTC